MSRPCLASAIASVVVRRQAAARADAPGERVLKSLAQVAAGIGGVADACDGDPAVDVSVRGVGQSAASLDRQQLRLPLPVQYLSLHGRPLDHRIWRAQLAL